MQTLENIDRELFLFFNSAHTEWLDPLMWFLSGRIIWLPVVVLIVYFLVRKFGKSFWIAFIAIALCYLLTEQLSVFIKDTVQRYRPTHNTEISLLVHTVNNYRGALYGFVSSHAANSFGLALLSTLFIRKWWVALALFIWAFIVSYSRIYMGVHYPADIAAGAALGIMMATLIYFPSVYFMNKMNSRKDKIKTEA